MENESVNICWVLNESIRDYANLKSNAFQCSYQRLIESKSESLFGTFLLTLLPFCDTIDLVLVLILAVATYVGRRSLYLSPLFCLLQNTIAEQTHLSLSIRSYTDFDCFLLKLEHKTNISLWLNGFSVRIINFWLYALL